jgi:predicted regulator of Ras-like GTPase activity (Roadblock/LC7/MglB family)
MSSQATTLSTTTDVQRNKLGHRLNLFAAEVANVSYVLAVSGDGITLAGSDHVPDEARDQVAAAASGMHGLARGIGPFVGSAVDKIVVQFEQGWMILQPTSIRIFLLAFTDLTADLGQVHFELIRLGESIGELLDPGARTSA